MKFAPSPALILISSAVIALSMTVHAKPKKVPAKAATPAPSPQQPVRMPGYAIIEKELGNRDTLRIAEGESRATIPAVLANEVDIVTVVGANTVVTLYEKPNFQGHSLTLTCGNYELLQQPRNDIESVKVTYLKKPVSACQGSDEQKTQLTTWTR
jgi:hypothetical protein